MENLKLSKGLFLYLRYSLPIGVLVGISISLCHFFYQDKPFFVDVIHFIILSSAIPGFMILPGIIYKPFTRDKAVPIDQMLYYSITVISLGIVPALIYFIKYDSLFNAKLKKES